MMRNNPNQASFNSYKGWVKHCNGKHLLKTIINGKELL